MIDWKSLLEPIFKRWPLPCAVIAIFGYWCCNLNIQQVNMTVQTKDKGRFFAGWDHGQMDQVTSAQKKKTPALPKAPKSSKRKKANK